MTAAGPSKERFPRGGERAGFVLAMDQHFGDRTQSAKQGGFMLSSGIGQIEITSASRARRIKRRFEAVITIEDPDQAPSHRVRFHTPPIPPHLVLQFEDLDEPHDGIRTATVDQVSAAIAFARENQHATLLVHCHAGIARSTAISLAIITDRLGAGQEAAALAEVVRLQQFAVPNLIVVGHADAILGRDGALIGTVLNWDTGREWNADRRKTNRDAILAHYAKLTPLSARSVGNERAQ